jgi:hypothetical protein
MLPAKADELTSNRDANVLAVPSNYQKIKHKIFINIFERVKQTAKAIGYICNPHFIIKNIAHGSLERIPGKTQRQVFE